MINLPGVPGDLSDLGHPRGVGEKGKQCMSGRRCGARWETSARVHRTDRGQGQGRAKWWGFLTNGDN